MKNPWKWAAFVLFSILMLHIGWESYWHMKWWDAQMYRNTVDINAIVQYLNSHPLK